MTDWQHLCMLVRSAHMRLTHRFPDLQDQAMPLVHAKTLSHISICTVHVLLLQPLFPVLQGVTDCNAKLQQLLQEACTTVKVQRNTLNDQRTTADSLRAKIVAQKKQTDASQQELRAALHKSLAEESAFRSSWRSTNQKLKIELRQERLASRHKMSDLKDEFNSLLTELNTSKVVPIVIFCCC